MTINQKYLCQLKKLKIWCHQNSNKKSQHSKQKNETCIEPKLKRKKNIVFAIYSWKNGATNVQNVTHVQHRVKNRNIKINTYATTIVIN